MATKLGGGGAKGLSGRAPKKRTFFVASLIHYVYSKSSECHVKKIVILFLKNIIQGMIHRHQAILIPDITLINTRKA